MARVGRQRKSVFAGGRGSRKIGAIQNKIRFRSRNDSLRYQSNIETHISQMSVKSTKQIQEWRSVFPCTLTRQLGQIQCEARLESSPRCSRDKSMERHQQPKRPLHSKPEPQSSHSFVLDKKPRFTLMD